MYNPSDPVDEFIGEQLKSISVLGGTTKGKSKGSKSLHLWPYSHHKESRSVRNVHEDRLIDALDRKYKRGYRRQYKLVDLLEKGYSQKEAAMLLGVRRETINRDIKKIRRRFKLWKETPQPIAQDSVGNVPS